MKDDIEICVFYMQRLFFTQSTTKVDPIVPSLALGKKQELHRGSLARGVLLKFSCDWRRKII